MYPDRKEDLSLLETFTVVNAPVQEKQALKRLMELYIYDFSEFLPLDVDEEGFFGYPYFDEYWSDPARHPFFIKVDGKLAGFILGFQEKSSLLRSLCQAHSLRRCSRHVPRRAAWQLPSPALFR